MTRDEFMKHAEQEIEQAFRGQRNRMMNLVEQAWAEGKRNAEVDTLVEAVKEAYEKKIQTITVTTQPITAPYPVQPINVPSTPCPTYPWTTPIITCEGTKPPEAHFSKGDEHG